MNRLIGLIAAALFSLSAFAAPSIPEILPATTFAVMGSPNLTALREGFDRSPYGELWRDAEVQAFVKPLVDKVNERFNDPASAPVITPQEFFDLFPGQVYGGVIHFTPLAPEDAAEVQAAGGRGGYDIAFFFAAETSRPERVLEIVDKILETSGAEQSRDTYTVQDVTVSRNRLRFREAAPLPGDPNAQPADFAGVDRTVTFHTAVVDGLVILSVDEPLETMISNLRGSGDGGLAASSSFASTRTLAGNPDSQFLMHINPGPFNQTLLQMVESSDRFNPAALGLGDIQGISSWTSFGPDTMSGWMAVSVAENATGLGRLLRHGASGDYGALAWVPGDVARVSGLHYDLAGAWGDLRKILAEASPRISTTLDTILQTAVASAGFNPETDLLNVLGNEIVNYTRIQSGATPDDTKTSNAMIFALTAPDRVEGVLARLAEPASVGSQQVQGGTGMLEAKECLGQTYYCPPSPFSGEMAGAASMPQAALAVLSGHLIYASSVEEMQGLIAASQGQIEGALQSTPKWTQIQAAQIEGANGFSYQDDAEMMAAGMQDLAQMGFMLMMFTQGQIPLDFTKVPSRAVFDRLLTHTVTSTRIAATGFTLHSVSPNRE